jgi:hypothetical protein
MVTATLSCVVVGVLNEAVLSGIRMVYHLENTSCGRSSHCREWARSSDCFEACGVSQGALLPSISNLAIHDIDACSM